ncbi:MAG: AAA family ATPase [Bacteroidia bacterium]
MITRLKIDGFKNLVGVDIRFGPLTCIAGLNAVGKSNLFDAIRFLSDLADKTLISAAVSVRSEGQKNADIRSLFHRVGNAEGYRAERMSFEVEMLIPKIGIDELGQTAEATITSVKYSLILKLISDNSINGDVRIEIEKEELVPITQTQAKKNVRYYASEPWMKSVIKGKRGTPFISTTPDNIVRLHSDLGGDKGGRPLNRQVMQLKKTVLSSVDASQSPTALIVKNEMMSWRMLQLEPSSLRQSDELHSIQNARLGADGAHLPATLYRLQLENEKTKNPPNIYKLLSNRLSELVDDISDLEVDKDDKRELLTLIVKDKNGTPHPARALSDGTLRFIGLAVLELDNQSNGVICLEEPENGIHPEKIASVIKLLEDICTDTEMAIGDDNPLRQVIINTHSPLVVQEIYDDSLLMAELKEDMTDKKIHFKKTVFNPLISTWRTKIDKNTRPVSKGKLLAYLGASDNEQKTEISYAAEQNAVYHSSHKKRLRVRERKDIANQTKILYPTE